MADSIRNSRGYGPVQLVPLCTQTRDGFPNRPPHQSRDSRYSENHGLSPLPALRPERCGTLWSTRNIRTQFYGKNRSTCSIVIFSTPFVQIRPRTKVTASLSLKGIFSPSVFDSSQNCCLVDITCLSRTPIALFLHDMHHPF
jgi:hypothetical protein